MNPRPLFAVSLRAMAASLLRCPAEAQSATGMPEGPEAADWESSPWVSLTFAASEGTNSR